MNLDFKLFLVENDKNMQDVKETLERLPKKHANLIKKYKIIWENGNTLKGDNEHVGVVDDSKKTITLAASYNYGREFVLLHEISHLIWKNLVSRENKKKWFKIAKPYQKKLNDGLEEIFAMIYGNLYCQNPVMKFNIPELMNFVKKIV